jgi:hypothetical protein
MLLQPEWFAREITPLPEIVVVECAGTLARIKSAVELVGGDTVQKLDYNTDILVYSIVEGVKILDVEGDIASETDFSLSLQELFIEGMEPDEIEEIMAQLDNAQSLIFDVCRCLIRAFQSYKLYLTTPDGQRLYMPYGFLRLHGDAFVLKKKSQQPLFI